MRDNRRSGVPMAPVAVCLPVGSNKGKGKTVDTHERPPFHALMLKRRLLGENPCNLDKLFRKIKQFGHHGRQGGGVCGVEMALMDLAGKAYGVPAYALVGGKFRDRIRMYCDTPNEPTGAAMGTKLQEQHRAAASRC